MLLTESPDGELMLRLVLRSTALEARIRSRLPALLEAVPALRVVTINVQPEHKAVLEGEREIVLTDTATLPMRLATGVTLRLGPRSFFQTNTAVAEALYDQARAVGARPARRPHRLGPLLRRGRLRAPPRRARAGRCWASRCPRTRSRPPAPRRPSSGVAAEFVAADATAYALASDAVPDLVVVNPPRRGIGPDLAGWLETSGVRHVVYSSCNAESLARDLALMPSLRPVEARVLDMFPHTTHYEVMVLLAR